MDSVLAIRKPAATAGTGPCRGDGWRARCWHWAGLLAAFVLVSTASVKLAWLFHLGTAERIGLRSPSLVFPLLSELHLVEMVIAAEYLVALVVLLSASRVLSFSLVAWLGTSFLGYHLCLAALGYGLPCHCLGTWHGAWQRRMDVLALILLGILLVVGWGGLGAHGWSLLRARLGVAKGRRALLV
jgi:hypothetical protein